MSEAVAGRSFVETRPVSRPLVLGLFLFSGMSALIYQVIWSRLCALLLGTTVYSVSTVVGVFMGGLALGSWFFGRLADRPRANGLKIFGGLELGIGAYALVLPLLLDLADSLYRAAWPAVADSFGLMMALKVLLAASVLIVPATLMGGTLPVLSRYLVRSRAQTGSEIGYLYSINTLGAVLGCFLAGFFLLERLGAHASLMTAATVNGLVGAAALLWAFSTPTARAEIDGGPAPASSRYTPGQIRLALIVYACSGFAALALEVLWTRSLLYFTSVDTWAFTAMLCAYLSGLGAGSLIMSRFVQRIRHPLLALGIIEVLIGLTAAASIPLFRVLYGAHESVADMVPSLASLTGKIVTKLFCAFFIMLVPTLLMGAAFPLVSAIYVSAKRQIGRGVGTLYALNTVGAIVGSLGAAFVLIPLLRLQHSILLCSSIYVLLGIVLLAAIPREPAGRRAGTIFATAMIALLALGNLAFEGRPMVLESYFFKDPRQPHRLVYLNEGPSASLAVLENNVGTRLLNINGVTTAINNHMDMQVHRMLSHLPLLLHPNPQTALVVGFGMGSTPWGCCQHPLERVDVVELLRKEKETAQYFEDINHGVLNHPKLNFIVGDGRNYLLATDERYDMISFNAIHPRFSANLYTKDFYELCRARLTPNGVICAWLTQNAMTDSEFRMLVRSLVDVFPHSSLWYCNPEHFCLIGLLEPTQIDLADWQRRMTAPAIARDLEDSNLDDPYVLATRYMFGEEALREYVRGAPLNTDDRPLIEFARETKAFERPIIDRLIELSVAEQIPVVPTEGDAPAERFAAYRRGALHLMRGQMEFWYPQRPGSLLHELEYRRALLECPDNQDVRHNLAFSDDVEEAVQTELERNPGNVGAWTRLGVIHLEQGRLEEARDTFNVALQQESRFIPAAAHLGLVYLLRGELEAARALLANVLPPAGPLEPPAAPFAYAFGETLERLRSETEAGRWKQRALEAVPEAQALFELRERTIEVLRSREAAPAG